MQATVMERFGGPEVLVSRDVPDPVAQDGWVVVNLEAAALNWHDVLVRQGRYDSPIPHIAGADGAGRRADTGEQVLIVPSLWWGEEQSSPGPDWQILGDRVPGTYAERVAVPEECVVPRPRGLSWAESAALPLVGLTVYRALFTQAGLRSGDRLLVLGASGGIATTAVAFAVAIGADVVVTSSNDDKIARARGHGARDGLRHDAADWVGSARDITPGRAGFDVVLDSVGRWTESIAAARPGGRIVVLGASAAEHASIDVRDFYFGQYRILGTTMGSPADFAGLMHLFDTTSVRPPVVDTVMALDEVSQAHHRLEAGDGFGKIVIRTGDSR